MGKLFEYPEVKGGVKTNVFARITTEKSYLETRGISKELFDRLCEVGSSDSDEISTEEQKI